MTHLIIGRGEVGQALQKILKPRFKVAVRDKKDSPLGPFDVLHVAYPWTKNFVRDTDIYTKTYTPKLIIIHSTVPVGTTANVGSVAVHSPVRGSHPHLVESMRTFVKYFGGPKAKEAASIFSDIGIPTKIFKKAETTELAKLLDTAYYAWNIMFAKEVARICEARGLDFDEVYTIPNTDYNKGYKALGKEEVVRPVLEPKEGPIGGHCVVPNAELLEDWITNVIRERNKKY